MRKTRNFSVVMATYTGVDTIDSTFDSLLNQKNPGVSYEIIIVIDGPNDALRGKVDSAKKKFLEKNIPLTVKQFNENKGRFEARLEGARLAKYQHILIVDDRVELPDNAFKFVCSRHEEAIMPDVTEKPSNNFISLTLSHVRHKIYKGKWGSNFRPYYIDKKNFDQSPKGTAALWVSKAKFIDACAHIVKSDRDTKHSSDDTRLLSYIVDSGVKIYKTSELKLVYTPRDAAWEELVHLYKRGPKFVDYYFRPGTRFFWPLVSFYILLIPLAILIVVFPGVLIGAILFSIFLSFWLDKGVANQVSILSGLWVIMLSFGLGLITGAIGKLTRMVSK